MKKLMLTLVCLIVLTAVSVADGATLRSTIDRNDLTKQVLRKDSIVFIPQDNRPVSNKMAADTIRCLGYEVLVPSDELLGSREEPGDADKLWDWLDGITGKPDIKRKSATASEIKAVVLSADSMLYGSLVASRKHELSTGDLNKRLRKFAKFRQDHPEMKLYVFSSIMRTPKSAANSGTEEPEYYRQYGEDIFRYTVLTDMSELQQLSPKEKKELELLELRIPFSCLNDWLHRRKKNYNINNKLLQLTREGCFSYFVLGRDDNAPWSQTHMESRHLMNSAADLSENVFQSSAGIDECGLLLLTRAVNEIKMVTPQICVKYNWGSGSDTVPAYSDEKIDKTIRSHIKIIGGRYLAEPEKADLQLFVNTNPYGKTYEAHWLSNDGRVTNNTKYFSDIVEASIRQDYPVAVADIAYANGSDNALMEELNDRGLLYKLLAYSGWNTPTNSTGFALAQGVLAKSMTEGEKNQLLTVRFLDDWGYQANIRQVAGRQLSWFKGSGIYSSLGDKRENIEQRITSLLHTFAERTLPVTSFTRSFRVFVPWNRLFEIGFQ